MTGVPNPDLSNRDFSVHSPRLRCRDRRLGTVASAKRLRRRAHKAADGAERITLAPLTFEEAVKGALTTKPPKTDDRKEGDDGDRT